MSPAEEVLTGRWGLGRQADTVLMHRACALAAHGCHLDKDLKAICIYRSLKRCLPANIWVYRQSPKMHATAFPWTHIDAPLHLLISSKSSCFPSHLSPRQADYFTAVARLSCLLLFWCYALALWMACPIHSQSPSPIWRGWRKAQDKEVRKQSCPMPCSTYDQRWRESQQCERNAECAKGRRKYGGCEEGEPSTMRRPEVKNKKLKTVSLMHIPRPENTWKKTPFFILIGSQNELRMNYLKGHEWVQCITQD